MESITTAIVIMAPYEVQMLAIPLLRKYSLDNFIHVPAHITILFPFVPFDQIEDAYQKLRRLCAEIEPFNVTVSGFGEFPKVLFMKPVDPKPIQALFGKIHAAFPQYLPYRGAFGDHELVPHVTVGQFATDSEQHSAVTPEYPPVTFKVDRLHLMYGIEHEPLPWLTYDVIRLKID